MRRKTSDNVTLNALAAFDSTLMRLLNVKTPDISGEAERFAGAR
jgi:hypothetical protein